jgi:hypothetical protein
VRIDSFIILLSALRFVLTALWPVMAAVSLVFLVGLLVGHLLVAEAAERTPSAYRLKALVVLLPFLLAASALSASRAGMRSAHPTFLCRDP